MQCVSFGFSNTEPFRRVCVTRASRQVEDSMITVDIYFESGTVSCRGLDIVVDEKNLVNLYGREDRR